MKTEIKLSLKQIGVVVFAYESFIKHHYSKTREAKVARSILDKLIIKFKKKLVDQSFAPTLFQKPKKFRFSLEIFEAHYLEQFVMVMENHPMSEYDKNVLMFIKSNLNQQLA